MDVKRLGHATLREIKQSALHVGSQASHLWDRPPIGAKRGCPMMPLLPRG